MTHPFESELSGPLAAIIRDLDQAPEAAVETAQQRLVRRLRGVRRPSRSRLRLALVTASAAAVVAILVLAPIQRGGGAFAAVIDHFRNFRTLSMTIVQRARGHTIQTSHTTVNAQGVVRTDIGDQLSVIVDPTKGRVLTLVHGDKRAILGSIPVRTVAHGESLQWLETLREFKGQATPISETRSIDGQIAHGWKLQVQGVDMEIWADANGLPLSMRQNGGAGMELDYRFEFNHALPPGELSSAPPAGYQLVKPDKE